VFNKDVKNFGKQHLFDKNDETCWSSEDGPTQAILLAFSKPVTLESIAIMYQGGYSSKELCLEVVCGGDTTFVQAETMRPTDTSDLQLFDMVKPIRNVQKLALKSLNASDLFGRIVIYKLDLFGTFESL
jgi:hypothetical protein